MRRSELSIAAMRLVGACRRRDRLANLSVLRSLIWVGVDIGIGIDPSSKLFRDFEARFRYRPDPD
jgi:hypothetical protein